MSEKAVLTIDGYKLAELELPLDRHVLECFRDTDLTDIRLPQKFWHHILGLLVSKRDLRYLLTREDAISRLDLMGYTLERTKEAFDTGVEEFLFLFDSYYDDGNDEEHRVALNLKFSAYEDFAKQLIKKRIAISELERAKFDGGAAAIPETLSPDIYEFCFPSNNPCWAIRLFLEHAPRECILALDISPLYHSGQISWYTNLCEESRERIREEHSRAATLLVLTEGSSDSDFLRRSLALIYPHLVGYVSFLDFAPVKLQGGASELAKTIKSLASAGLSNRVVAIADNDAIAHEALGALKAKKLPSNIRIIHYPEIPLIKQYPVLGADGKPEELDITGSAASIELYFGEDILEDGTGSLTPVRTGSYIQKLGKHQGEIENKTALQKKFRAKLDMAEEVNKQGQAPNFESFSGMRAILDAILSAFN